MNGISSHVYDFDDTTPQNYIHPTSPVASALFAYASAHPVSGRDFVHAFVLGFEVESRVGNAVYPVALRRRLAHHRHGRRVRRRRRHRQAARPDRRSRWSGRSAWRRRRRRACARCSARWASRSTRAARRRTATRPRCWPRPASPPASAASKGRAASPPCRPRQLRPVEDRRRASATTSTCARNTYKPYPCGIVNHPTIDGCIQLHDAHALDGRDDRAPCALRVAPLVLDLCNQKNITRGLQGKFSVYHGAAIGLVRGTRRARRNTPTRRSTIRQSQRVREATTAVGDASLTEDQAHRRGRAHATAATLTHVRRAVARQHPPAADRSSSSTTSSATQARARPSARRRSTRVARAVLADRRARRRARARRGDGPGSAGGAHRMKLHRMIVLAAARTCWRCCRLRQRPGRCARCAFPTAPAASASCRCWSWRSTALIEKHARDGGHPRSAGALDRARRARRPQRRAAVGLGRLHRRRPAGLHHAVGSHARFARRSRASRR